MFVYDALLEALAVGDTAIPCSLYMQKYTELKRQNPSTGKSLCREEFEVILFSDNKIYCCLLTADVSAAFSNLLTEIGILTDLTLGLDLSPYCAKHTWQSNCAIPLYIWHCPTCLPM